MILGRFLYLIRKIIRNNNIVTKKNPNKLLNSNSLCSPAVVLKIVKYVTIPNRNKWVMNKLLVNNSDINIL
jgi:hypothetical protein